MTNNTSDEQDTRQRVPLGDREIERRLDKIIYEQPNGTMLVVALAAIYLGRRLDMIADVLRRR